MLAPLLGEAWPSWPSPFFSLIVHDAALLPGLGTPGRQVSRVCVPGDMCLGLVAGRPHA